MSLAGLGVGAALGGGMATIASMPMVAESDWRGAIGFVVFFTVVGAFSGAIG